MLLGPTLKITFMYKSDSYRDGANDGFHEAIGELMAMAGSTPKYLYTIGLMEDLVEDTELDLNFLMRQVGARRQEFSAQSAKLAL